MMEITADVPKPAPGDAPYIDKDAAAKITLGRKLRFRPSWPQEGHLGCGPEAEVVAISNDPASQTQRILIVRDKRDRMVRVDAAWFQLEPWMDPFYEP